jgi:hypothetical protein
MAVTPVDMQGVIAYGTQADGVDILSGDRSHHLEGIGWRLFLLSPQLATDGTRAYLAQLAVWIEALVPIIPEYAHPTLIVPLDLYRVERFMGVSHRTLTLTLTQRVRVRDAHLNPALSIEAPQKQVF